MEALREQLAATAAETELLKEAAAGHEAEVKALKAELEAEMRAKAEVEADAALQEVRAATAIAQILPARLTAAHAKCTITPSTTEVGADGQLKVSWEGVAFPGEDVRRRRERASCAVTKAHNSS